MDMSFLTVIRRAPGKAILQPHGLFPQGFPASWVTFLKILCAFYLSPGVFSEADHVVEEEAKNSRVVAAAAIYQLALLDTSLPRFSNQENEALVTFGIRHDTCSPV